MLVHDRQRLTFVRGIDPSQALHASDQVLLSIRPIGEPAAAAAGARAGAGIGEPCEAELGVRIDGDATAGLRPGVGAEHARKRRSSCGEPEAEAVVPAMLHAATMAPSSALRNGAGRGKPGKLSSAAQPHAAVLTFPGF